MVNHSPEIFGIPHGTCQRDAKAPFPLFQTGAISRMLVVLMFYAPSIACSIRIVTGNSDESWGILEGLGTRGKIVHKKIRTTRSPPRPSLKTLPV